MKSQALVPVFVASLLMNGFFLMARSEGRRFVGDPNLQPGDRPARGRSQGRTIGPFEGWAPG
jgi:hypothetical protein